ncbi:hypothetical protein [uncultured Chryseobacterium sp.]|uniref:hypothetical protein n=1 Tax=uncultured Chryseobacterium sp. TaxID=259322 RepID=UPI0025F2A82E|nr:hypothetical protein [uncultured Chryseobacterium sp.]
MDFKSIAKKIIGLKNADLELRDRLIGNGELGNGYHGEMQALHHKMPKYWMKSSIISAILPLKK